MSWPYLRVVSHRGGGILAPENTLSAMKIPTRYGAASMAVEFDVMLTKDNVPIIVHDEVLGRTICGCGNISDVLAAEIDCKDAGKWWDDCYAALKQAVDENSKVDGIMKSIETREQAQIFIAEVERHSLPTPYAGEKVPTFEAVANYCKANGIFMNIEIKPAPGFEVITGEVVARRTEEIFAVELAEEPYVLTNVPLLSSFSFDALNAAKIASPKLPRSMLFEDIPDDWRDIMASLEANNVHCDDSKLTQQLAGDIKTAGFGLLCYTVNTVERASLLYSWGVDSICTDRIDLFA